MKQFKTNGIIYRSINYFWSTLKWINLGAKVQAERKQILNLDEDQLRDIGVSREEAIREGQRSFGEIPASRMQTTSSPQELENRYPAYES